MAVSATDRPACFFASSEMPGPDPGSALSNPPGLRGGGGGAFFQGEFGGVTIWAPQPTLFRLLPLHLHQVRQHPH